MESHTTAEAWAGTARSSTWIGTRPERAGSTPPALDLPGRRDHRRRSDGATPVSGDYGPKDDCFTGRVGRVQLDIDEAAEDVSHLITPEEHFRLAIARQ